MSIVVEGLIALDDLPDFDFDIEVTLDAARAFARATSRLADIVADAASDWQHLPSVFSMETGAADSLFGALAPAHAAAAALRSSAEALAAVIDSAEYGVSLLLRRRSRLEEEVAWLHAVAPARVAEVALTATSLESPQTWRDVASLVADDAELRAEAAGVTRDWRAAMDDLADSIRRIEGGERSTLDLIAPGAPRVIAASAVLPSTPGLSFDGAEILLPIWEALPGLATGLAVGGAAIGEGALVLSLGGDTSDAPRSVPPPAWTRGAAAAAGPEALRLYDLTNTPGRTPLLNETDSAGPAPETIDDVSEVLDRMTRPVAGSPHREVDSPEELAEVHDAITRGGEALEPQPNTPIVSSTRLEDGTIINWRGSSKSGGPGVDITVPGVKGTLKIHLPKGYGK